VTRFPLDDSERAAVLSSFLDKCRARGIVPAVASISDSEVVARARAEWDTLKLEIGDLPDFETCFVKVEALYRTLPRPVPARSSQAASPRPQLGNSTMRQ
jgi:hypothetical protein